jgi:hypothetical protein
MVRKHPVQVREPLRDGCGFRHKYDILHAFNTPFTL